MSENTVLKFCISNSILDKVKAFATIENKTITTQLAELLSIALFIKSERAKGKMIILKDTYDNY